MLTVLLVSTAAIAGFVMARWLESRKNIASTGKLMELLASERLQSEERAMAIVALKEELRLCQAQVLELHTLRETLSRQEAFCEERGRTIADLKEELCAAQRQVLEASKLESETSAKYQVVLRSLEDERTFIETTKTSLKDAFSTLSSQALSQNSDTFLTLVRAEIEKQSLASQRELEKRGTAVEVMIKPLKESLDKFSSQVQDVEKSRLSSYSELKTLIGSVGVATEKLDERTGTLVNALKTSHVRGRYGEIGLRRVIEFTGLNDYCDFEEQTSVKKEDATLRPDLIVRLPGERRIVIDSKAPLLAYLQSFEAPTEVEKLACQKKHVTQFKEHIKALSSKGYWKQFDNTVDFVVMYVNVESAFGAALEVDRELIQYAMENGVVLATPTTLIAMLKSISFCWQQSRMTDNVFQLQKAGVELYNRTVTLLQHMAGVGDDLNSATKSYNKLVSSMETRFMPQARKIKELGGGMMKNALPELSTIEEQPRQLRPAEIRARSRALLEVKESIVS